MPTALIIGTSRGLGRALVEEHLRRGWRVIATVRQPDALANIDHDALTVATLDTTDGAGVDRLCATIAGEALDLLFVNAGIMDQTLVPIGEVDEDAFTRLMLVNAFAPLRIVDRLADRVAAAGTIAVMTSSLGSLADNKMGLFEAYRMSKAALNQGLISIAIRRKDARTYLACNPGWVRTDLGGAQAPLSIAQSIPALTDAIAARAGQGGVAFLNYDGEELPW